MDFLTETRGKINAQKAKKAKSIAHLAIAGVAAVLLPSCASTGNYDSFATRTSSSFVHTYRTPQGGVVTERSSREFRLSDVGQFSRDLGRTARDISSARYTWLQATSKFKKSK